MTLYLLNRLRKALNLPQNIDAFLIWRFPMLFFMPHMTNNELLLIKKYAINCKEILEYGSGGSTFYFIRKNKKIISVENNKPYFCYMKTFNVIKRYKNLDYQFVDTGKSSDWGYPVDDTKKENWPQYYKKVWEKLNISCPDIIFIDGRFRVMCALESIQYIRMDTIIIIHDFLDRKYYGEILNYFELIDQVDTMAILKKKPTINLAQLEESKLSFKYDYR